MSTTNLDTGPTNHQTSTASNITHIGANILLIGLWLWLYGPVFSYLTVIFSREDFRTNQLVLLGIIILIAFRMHREELRPRINATPQLYIPAIALALGGAGLYLLVERFLDVNTLSASLFALASYGFLGMWMRPARWRQGFPAALLIIGVLPFGEHLQTFVGYPMRILTAAIIRDGLAVFGITSIGVDTILVLENGVSKVDLPCSGVKSLWTGMLFLVAATWIERRQLNHRWLLTASIFVVLLFIANLTRVGVLVVVGQVFSWPIVAEMLHIPLGVLGFIATCAGGAGLLWLQPALAQDTRPPHNGQPDTAPGNSKFRTGNAMRGLPKYNLGTPKWLVPFLIIALLVMAFIYTPRPQTGLTQAPPTWNFPATLTIQPMPLKPDEFEWLTRDGAESADRHRFKWQGVSGSMILITSKTWRAHHRPERCFEVYGLSLGDSHTHLVNPNFPVRVVSLGNDHKRNLLSATYWFQSTTHTTDDYATRIWADLTPERERWVLVSILFDEAPDPDSPDVQALYTTLHAAVTEKLKGEPTS